MSALLHKLDVNIFCCAREHNIDVEIHWIPRTLNVVADFLSKTVDLDDWRVKDCYFQAIQSRWGLFTIDCFASCQNFKVSRFYSRYYNPGSHGVDCFSFSWSNEFCWLAPPIHLIPRAIQHVLLCRCRAVIVVPFWPSAVFWPLIVNYNGVLREFVLDSVFVQNGREVYEHGANKLSLFGSNNFNTPVLFLLLDGARPPLTVQ